MSGYNVKKMASHVNSVFAVQTFYFVKVWPLVTLGNVPTAFLNPNLDIDLLMELPKGYERHGCVIQLQKGLYGLKQAGEREHPRLA